MTLPAETLPVLHAADSEALERLAPVLEDARRLAAAARAPRTRDAYRAQWRAFESWSAANAMDALPTDPLGLTAYLTTRARSGWSVATLAQALAAISEANKVAGHPSPRESPIVREVWKGIRRELGVAPRRVAPILVVRGRGTGSSPGRRMGSSPGRRMGSCSGRRSGS